MFVSVKNVSIKSVFNVLKGHSSEFKVEQLQKLKEWWTDDVDGDCISFHSFRNTESSIILLKTERRSQKKKYCQNYRQRFYLEELTQR